MKTIEEINQHNVKKILSEKKIPDFYPGDVVKVGVRMTEGKKERIQYFEGVCIAKKSRDLNSSFTVRKISFGEGVDGRVLSTRKIEEISIGDYILSGGETAAFVMIDSILRLLPGVLGNENSRIDESFENGLLEYPQYTKPQIWEEKAVPEVLLSGDHSKIKDWRLSQSEAITRVRRPDLWQKYKTVSYTHLTLPTIRSV